MAKLTKETRQLRSAGNKAKENAAKEGEARQKLQQEKDRLEAELSKLQVHDRLFLFAGKPEANGHESKFGICQLITPYL